MSGATVRFCECGDHAWRTTSSGHTVLVSTEDAGQFRWAWKVVRKAKGYLQVCRSDRKTTMTLSREILSAPCDRQVDHINSDSLDNRRSNLRLCTPLQNAHNRRRERNATNPFKGVWQLRSGRFRASIMLEGKRTYLGTFDTAEEAHAAYSAGAVRLHGEFARAA